MYIDAASVLLTKNRSRLPEDPIFFLAFHGIELLLKAFLRARGVTVRQLRSRELGHNLERLLDLAKQRGLADCLLDLDRLERYISWFGGMYASKMFEYSYTGTVTYPDEPELVAAELVAEGFRLWGAVYPSSFEAFTGERASPYRLREAAAALKNGHL